MNLQELTDDQIDAMEAGPEMDRLVGEAVEWSVVEEFERDISRREWAWRPSKEWAPAMFAAERSGLFSRLNHILAQSEDAAIWIVMPLENMYSGGDTTIGHSIAHGDTGPLAICRGILKLTRNK